MHSFVSLDFETCQYARSSPIQIGVVKVVDGQVLTPYSTAVMPPEGFRRFEPRLQQVHNLTPGSIEDAPEWPDILSRLEAFATHDGRLLPLVAHNASFERSVINATSQVLGLSVPPFRYICTLKAARAILRTPNHKLGTLCAHLGITQENHHDAGDDALVAAHLALALEAQRAGVLSRSHL